MKQTIGVIFGGASSEYEVSLMSAASVINNIDLERFDIIKLGICKDGRMFLYNGDIKSIENDSWEKGDVTPCLLSHNPAHHGVLLLDGKNTVIRLDVVFPVLHGKNGEDGTIQGLLALAEIPFVGCDTLSSAVCMDKALTHILLSHAGISCTEWLSVKEYDYRQNSDDFINQVSDALGFPCFVKPANAGSSVGISKAKTRDELIAAMELAFKNDGKVLCEKMVSGRELECAVLGNSAPIASCIGEILSCNDFYDYDAKYLAGKTITKAPAEIPDAVSDEIKEIAVKAYKALGCTGLSRIDFFLSDDGRILLNEVNTIPGFTSISMYSQLFAASGIPYGELVTKLIDFAIERG